MIYKLQNQKPIAMDILRWGPKDPQENQSHVSNIGPSSDWHTNSFDPHYSNIMKILGLQALENLR